MIKDENNRIFGDDDLIYQYLSDQAEQDGLLVNVQMHGEPIINYLTQGVWNTCVQPYAGDDQVPIPHLVACLKSVVLKEIIRIGKNVRMFPSPALLDWFYSVRIKGRQYYLCQNDTGGFTLLFPEEY